jgi:formate/nitrite transporter
MSELFGFDAYSPNEIAQRVQSVGVAKARLPVLTQVILGILAGGFIGLGALCFTMVASDTGLGFAAGRLLGGVAFSLGLILVVVAGAELFTGNNLLVMAWASGRIGFSELIRNWAIIYFANFVGAIGLALLVLWSQQWRMSGDAVGITAVNIAAAKIALPFWQAFFRGILCNILVCLAVWLTLAGRSVTDKILAIIFPIAAFVAAGFEHSVANMYFIPLGILVQQQLPTAPLPALNWTGMVMNLIAVSLGNIIGGSGMVGAVYYLVYCRSAKDSARSGHNLRPRA